MAYQITEEQELAAGVYTSNCSAQRETVHEFRPQPSAPRLTGYYDNTGTMLEQYNYRRWPELAPSAPPWRGGAAHWQGEAVASLVQTGHAAAHAFRMADEGGKVHVMFVNNLQVHVHQHVNGHAGSQEMLIAEGGGGAVTSLIEEQALQTQQLHFHANDPVFNSCAYSPQGLDFGHKAVSRRYRAQKHVHSQYNMITYTQCASTAQAISHALTLYLSHKRSKHAIFLFDGRGRVDELTSTWPSNIHFTDIESLIQQLGPDYEYHRRKVKTERFSLCFYVVKRIGCRFSEQGRRIWSGLFQWAHSLENSSVDRAQSDLSSSQVIAQVAGIGLGIVGVL